MSEPGRPLPMRGLCRAQAAAYIGIGATLFDRCVAEGIMPQPRAICGRLVWDRLELDEAFDDLPHKQGPSQPPLGLTPSPAQDFT